MQHTIEKYSLKVGTALMLIAWISPYFSLQKTYWIIISTMAVMLPTVGATLERSKRRAASTTLGVMIGGVLSFYLKDNTPIVYVISAFLLFYMCYNIQINYSRAIFAVSILLILIISHFYQTPWQFAFWRFIDTIIGILVAFIFAIAIFPCWSKKSAHRTLLNCFEHLKLLSTTILQNQHDHETVLLIEETRHELIQATEKLKKEYAEIRYETNESDKSLMIMESIIITLVRIRLDLYLMMDLSHESIKNEDMISLQNYSSQVLDSLISSINQKMAPQTIDLPNYQISENPGMKRVIRNYLSDFSTLQQNMKYYFC